MRPSWWVALSTLTLLAARPARAFEPLSFAATSIGAGVAGWAVSLAWDALKEAPVVRHVADSAAMRAIECVVRECCATPYVTRDVETLSSRLSESLHGQHLVTSLLPRVIKNHVRNERPRKPLVVSMHGSTGVGKNFATQQVAASLYKEGMRSRFVHLFVGSMDFPHDDAASVVRYSNDLRRWVLGNLSHCEHSLFIFDEVDKMPSSVLNGIRAYMDFHGEMRGATLGSAIFFLLSNTGGRAINKLMLDRWTDDQVREETTVDHFDSLLAKRAFSETGGLYRSDLVSSALVDLYLPFLPLERRHVELCVRDELRRRGVVAGAAEAIRYVLDQVRFDDAQSVFAKVGCKDVTNKVNMVIDYTMFEGGQR